MEIEFLCRECKVPNDCEADAETPVACKSCGTEFGVTSSFVDASGSVEYCGICKCRDLYTQKDFNRKVGVGIVAVGAILAPFTKMISLLVCAVIDLVLYKNLAVITNCYRCHTIYRGFAINRNHEGFNLGINDRYRAADR
jgi:hypothetical protein